MTFIYAEISSPKPPCLEAYSPLSCLLVEGSLIRAVPTEVFGLGLGLSFGICAKTGFKPTVMMLHHRTYLESVAVFHAIGLLRLMMTRGAGVLGFGMVGCSVFTGSNTETTGHLSRFLRLSFFVGILCNRNFMN